MLTFELLTHPKNCLGHVVPGLEGTTQKHHKTMNSFMGCEYTNRKPWAIWAVVQLGRAEIMLGNPKIKMGVALYRWMVCNGKSIQNWMNDPCRKPPMWLQATCMILHDSDSSETWRIRKECFWCPTLSTWFTTRLTMFLVIYSIPTRSHPDPHCTPIKWSLSTSWVSFIN